MKGKRFTEEKIISTLKEHDSGVAGDTFPDNAFFNWIPGSANAAPE